ncbi:MAG: ferredoxin [Bacteroidales bacterium]|nr:ferredoxin [Bacteroidales bacterium]
MAEDKNTKKSPISRREFLRKCGSVLAGGSILATGGALATKANMSSSDLFWQIDSTKCTQCGRCETDCVLPVSAVKCFHANLVCGYCDLCGGYYRPSVKDLNTAAENMMCPTGAITRKFVEEPYFEYTIDESLCNGCGKCVKGCTSFGNGSLFLQIQQDLCLNCNECKISRVCVSGAIQRVPYEMAYKLKDHA